MNQKKYDLDQQKHTSSFSDCWLRADWARNLLPEWAREPYSLDEANQHTSWRRSTSIPTECDKGIQSEWLNQVLSESANQPYSLDELRAAYVLCEPKHLTGYMRKRILLSEWAKHNRTFCVRQSSIHPEWVGVVYHLGQLQKHTFWVSGHRTYDLNELQQQTLWMSQGKYDLSQLNRHTGWM